MCNWAVRFFLLVGFSLGVLIGVQDQSVAASNDSPDIPSARGEPPDSARNTIPPSIPVRRSNIGDANRNGLSDSLEKRLRGRPDNETIDVIVTFNGSGDATTAQRGVGAFAVGREFSLINGFAAQMSAGQARALAAIPGVFRVEENAIASITLESSRRDFGVDSLRTDPTDVESQNPDGSRVRVCVLDTGIQGDHEQFAGRIKAFKDFTGDHLGTVQTVAYDDHGHGSHVAGIIAGDGVADNGVGGDPQTAPLAQGVAPGAWLYVAKVLDYTGNGADAGIIAALDWCVGPQRVDVANLSLTIPGSSDGQDALSLAVNAAVGAGVTVVVAAGNTGDGELTIGSPAAASQAITVGAMAEYSPNFVADADSSGVYVAPFSSRGPTLDGRVKPDLIAPGVSVLSALSAVVILPPDPVFGGGGQYDYGCGVGCYTIRSGTSMASPFVAGAAALMINAGSKLSPADIKQILINTAQEHGKAGADSVAGHGSIDVAAAVESVRGNSAFTTLPHAAYKTFSVASNGSVLIPITVNDISKPLAVTMLIDGAMTSSGWSPDLDVVLHDANGDLIGVENIYWTLFGLPPQFVPAPGTSSTCPAGEDCGPVGIQETIHINDVAQFQPTDRNYFLRVYPFADAPNFGQGGDFSVQLSNAYFSGPVNSNNNETIESSAGVDISVDADSTTGIARVYLDGRGSLGLIENYQWTESGQLVGSQAVLSVDLTVGTHEFVLTTTSAGVTDTDSVQVTVAGSTPGGGGNGGGNGGGGNGGGNGGGKGGGKPPK